MAMRLLTESYDFLAATGCRPNRQGWVAAPSHPTGSRLSFGLDLVPGRRTDRWRSSPELGGRLANVETKKPGKARRVTEPGDERHVRDGDDWIVQQVLGPFDSVADEKLAKRQAVLAAKNPAEVADTHTTEFGHCAFGDSLVIVGLDVTHGQHGPRRAKRRRAVAKFAR